MHSFKAIMSILISALVTLLNMQALASVVDTLPAGINSPSVRYGTITGIEQRYTNNSELYRLGELKSIHFNSENLSRLSSRAAVLIGTLNRFGTQQLGKSIDYGTLKIDTKPQVQYTAPIYARGITDRWTLGMGFPIINYKNKIALVQENSNLDYYRSQFTGLSPELDEALNLDLVKEAKGVLRELGFKPIENRDETYLGDVQLVSAYRFWEKKDQGLLYTVTFNLPTGPKYDADDIIALNSFGRTGIENRVTFSQMLFSSSLEIAPYLSHNYFFTDQVDMRVPKSESDALPGADSKENVRRKIGETYVAGSEAFLNIGDRWSLGIGYAFADKKKDEFSGDRGRRYDLLSAETEARYERINAQIQYSTVKAYLKKNAFMPGIIAFNYIDTVAGRNIERRTVQEINMMMFF